MNESESGDHGDRPEDGRDPGGAVAGESSGEVIILDFKGGNPGDSCADKIVTELISRLNAREQEERYLLCG